MNMLTIYKGETVETLTEEEVRERWEKLAEAERKRIKQRDGGKLPDPPDPNKPKPKLKTYTPDRTKSHSYNPERYEQILKLVKEGQTNRAIGRMLGISDTSVRYWKKRYGMS